MSNLQNEVYIESLRQEFYESAKDGDWNKARAVLSELEDKRVSTYELRRTLNKEMAETDDITYEPFEAVIPLITDYEKRMWDEGHKTSQFSNEALASMHGASSEGMEQSRLSAEYGPNNA